MYFRELLDTPAPRRKPPQPSSYTPDKTSTLAGKGKGS